MKSTHSSVSTSDRISRRAVLTTIGAAGAGLCFPSLAQPGYPAKPIRVVVGYAPGGSVDMAGRIAADMLAKHLHATVMVDNVPGAAGVIGAQRVVNAAADGYTLLLGSCNEMAATRFANPAQKYDPLKDLAPLGLLGTQTLVWAAGPNMGVKTLDECIALVRKHPGQYSYGSSGVGSVLHFAGEMLKQKGHLEIMHVPYRGTAALTTDLVGGSLDFAMLSVTAAMPFIQGGRIVPLGVVSRVPALPQVPALGENAELKGYDLDSWFGLAGPRGLPTDIAQKISTAFQQGMLDEEFRKRLTDGQFGLPAVSGAQDLQRVMQADSRKYAELAKFIDMQ